MAFPFASARISAQPLPSRARPRIAISQIYSILAATFLLAAFPSARATPLSSALEIRSLSPEEASQALPVEMEGTVLGQTEPHRLAFVLIDDQGDNIYVSGPEDQIAPLRAGLRVQIIGQTDPGGYAPLVRLNSIKILGEGPLPTPLAVTLSDLSAGGLDSKWVETYGIVRSCRVIEHDTLPGKFATLIELAYGNERIGVQAQFPANPEELIDAEVRFRAICVNQHNPNRQFIRPALLVPIDSEITIIRKPSPPAFESEPVPISSLLEFFPNINYHHRVHVQGTVLHSIPGDSIWVRDASRALRVKTSQDQTFPANSLVSVAGFLYGNGFTPSLEDAEVRVLQPAAPAEPRPLSAYQDSFEFDNDLVRFPAVLTEKRGQADGVALRFEWQDSEQNLTVGTLMGKSIAANKLPPVGSLLEVTGICSVIPNETDNVSGSLIPSRFNILLRSPHDLKLLRPPPFWNIETMAWLLGILLALASLTALAIYIAAKQRLKEQAHRRSMAETEFTAILKERNRLAREIHDTLSQGLGAISVQLELAQNLCSSTSSALQHHLATAHKIVRASLGEARSSIWNMRSQILEKSDLPDALTAILHQLTDQTGIKAVAKVVGTRRRLSSTVENNLLRIGQEAITNATKHARPHHISLIVTFQKSEIRIEVNDDGQGFDRSQNTPSPNSFGIVGMKERADQIGAKLSLHSAPNQGTSLSVTVTG